jgi:cardiolipin synthase
MPDSSRERINPFRAMPNLLTLARICLAPVLVSAVVGHQFALGFALFVVAGLTDALDGLLARLLKQRTMLGQYLDPVADKLLLSMLFLVLTHEKLIPAWITALVFGRDVGILVVAALLFATVGRREFRPSIIGKANTAAQIIAVALVLLERVYAAAWVSQSRMVALNAAAVLTIASGIHYAWTASRRPANGGGTHAA